MNRTNSHLEQHPDSIFQLGYINLFSSATAELANSIAVIWGRSMTANLELHRFLSAQYEHSFFCKNSGGIATL